jgi:hypothetical protein
MTDTATAQAAAPMSLPARIFGVLFSPRETFANVAAFPKWFGILAVSLLIFAAAQVVFLKTDVGQQAALDQQVSQMEGFGVTVTDQQYEQMKGRMAYTPYIQGVAILLFGPLFTALFSGILYGVFSALGGQATFKQVLATLSHTSVLNIVQALFMTPLNYARASLSSATSLGVFLPMLEEGSFLANVFGALDLFVLWSIGLTSIGLSVLYKKKTSSIFIALVIVYLIIAVAIAAVKAAMGGS